MERVDQPESKLTPEQIERFVSAIKLVERRRKILLWGCFAALATLILTFLGMLGLSVALGENRFRFLVFLVPFALTGAVLWLFGGTLVSLFVIFPLAAVLALWEPYAEYADLSSEFDAELAYLPTLR